MGSRAIEALRSRSKRSTRSTVAESGLGVDLPAKTLLEGLERPSQGLAVATLAVKLDLQLHGAFVQRVDRRGALHARKRRIVGIGILEIDGAAQEQLDRARAKTLALREYPLVRVAFHEVRSVTVGIAALELDDVALHRRAGQPPERIGIPANPFDRRR